jgi:hypothetical protein
MASTENVVADTVSIKKLGELFLLWADEFDQILGDVALADVQPGYLDAAVLVKKRFEERVGQQFTQILTNLQSSLSDVGKALVRISKQYATAEDLNADDLARLNDMVKKVAKYFPDYNPLPDKPSV